MWTGTGIIFIGLMCSSSGQQLSDYKQLFTDVISNHQKHVVPRVNASTPLELETIFYIMTLGGFEELAETIDILGGIGLTWKDPDLTWNPSSYGGIVYMTISNSFVWNPPVILTNSINDLEPLAADTELNAIVTNDGNITVPIADVLRARCSADIFKFPYDSQKCTLQFNVWGFQETDVKFKLANTPVDESFYTPNSNWELVSISSSVRSWNGFSTYDIFITIKREPLYYSVIVICPTVAFALLNPLVFLLPVESGERIGLAMTILLSYAVFLTIVSASIPASSNPMSFLLIMMITTIVVSGVIVVEVIFIASVYYRDENQEMKNVWKCFGRWHREREIMPVNQVDDGYKDKTEIKKCHMVENISWKDVSQGLDYWCLLFGYIVIILIIIILFSVTMAS